jgi:hypothetical protein
MDAINLHLIIIDISMPIFLTSGKIHPNLLGKIYPVVSEYRLLGANEASLKLYPGSWKMLARKITKLGHPFSLHFHPVVLRHFSRFDCLMSKLDFFLYSYRVFLIVPFNSSQERSRNMPLGAGIQGIFQLPSILHKQSRISCTAT